MTWKLPLDGAYIAKHCSLCPETTLTTVKHLLSIYILKRYSSYGVSVILISDSYFEDMGAGFHIHQLHPFSDT